jgi:protein TonB
MQIKKYDKFSLENKRLFFFQIGFITSLLIILFVFEFVTTQKSPTQPTDIIELDLEYIPLEIVRIEKPSQPERISDNESFFSIVDETPSFSQHEQKTRLPENENTQPIIYANENEEEIVFSEFYNRKPIFNPQKCKTQEESEREILNFIKQNMVYPGKALEENIQAKIYVRFLIDKTGKLKNPTLLNKTNTDLDNEALRIVKKLNNWQAGWQNGEPAEMWYTIPIVFKLL